MNKKKIVIINILTVLVISFAIKAILSLIHFATIQQILLIPFQIIYQYAFIVIFAMNKTVLSRPLFDKGEKPFKRFYIDKLLILLGLEIAFDQLYSLYVTIAWMITPFQKGLNQTVYFILILIEVIVDYLLITKKDDSMKSSPKFLISAMSIGFVLTVAAAISYNVLLKPLDFEAESANLLTYVEMISYNSIADHIPAIYTFVLTCVFIIFHTQSIKGESISEREHTEEINS